MGFSPDFWVFFFFNKESQSYNFKPSELLYHIFIVKHQIITKILIMTH